MPDPAPPPPAPAAPAWNPLTLRERRVLGVLIEKQKTSKTADSYPMTINALTTGCNQKSNRDPVLDLTDDEVEEVITPLQKKGMMTRITGSRVDRYRHELYEAWTKDGRELAVLAELLLRGPQTKGDLRGRASRMTPIDTLDDLEDVLKPLVERKLVVYLTAPDRRGAVLSHGFHNPDEFARLKTYYSNAPVPAVDGTDVARALVSPTSPPPPQSPTAPAPALSPPPATPAPVAVLETKLLFALQEIEKLKAAVAALEQTVAELKKPVTPADSPPVVSGPGNG
jgi:uncharacterized protein YceH (UPF0502 family)